MQETWSSKKSDATFFRREEKSSKMIQREPSGRQVENGTAKMPPYCQSRLVIVDQFNRTTDQKSELLCRTIEVHQT